MTTWLAGLTLLWCPGYLITELLGVFRAEDRIVRFSIRIAAGLSIWPILFLFTSTAGWRWSTGVMRGAAIATLVTALALAAERLPRILRRSRFRSGGTFLAVVLIVAAVVVALRVSHARGIAFPPWVDGVHHVMMTRLLLENGLVPRTMDPYIAGGDFYYHWGFHWVAALVAALTGRTASTAIPGVLLDYGQLLNALTFVTMYAAGRTLLRSREAGLMTATLATCVSYFPAFYLSWGRYTHLAGTLVLPPLLIVLWRTIKAPGRMLWRESVVAVILAAGLALIHVRVAFFALTFAVVLAAILLARKNAAALLRWSAIAGAALIVVAPWLVRLRSDPQVRKVVFPSANAANEPLPMHLIGSAHNRELLAIASCGLTGMAGLLAMPLTGRVLSGAWWLLLIAVSRVPPKTARARRFAPWNALAIVGAWCGFIAICLYWRPAGIDLTRFASIDSAIITMFVPLSLAGGALITWAIHRLAPPSRATAAAYIVALAVAIGVGSLMTDVVNPYLVFADDADARAMQWIARNTPRDARFAVDARPWMYPAWVGVDGGYWLGVSTSRQSILPPLLYGWALPQPRVAQIDSLLARWSSPAAPDDPRAWTALRAARVTYIYCGTYANRQKRLGLLRSAHCRPVYRDGGAMVFELLR